MCRPVVIVAFVIVAALLSACGMQRETPGAEPDQAMRNFNCDGRQGSPAVVTIDMTEPPNFSVSPKKCAVYSGRPVEWTTTVKPPSNFEVRFIGRTPDPRGTTVFAGSRPAGDPHRNDPYSVSIPGVGRKIPGGDNEYEYVVVVNGVEIDPSIIIDQ